MPPTASESLILSALASLNSALTRTSLHPPLAPPPSPSSSSLSTTASARPLPGHGDRGAGEGGHSEAGPTITQATGTGETPRLARLRRRRNRLVAMLMFELTAVATGSMPEFAAYDVGTPWDFVPATDAGSSIEGGVAREGIHEGRHDDGSGGGTGNDAGGTGPGLAIHSELGGSGMLWYLKQREGVPEDNEEMQAVVMSPPREVRRLAAVFEAGWKSVLGELDLNALARRGDEDDRKLAPFLWTEEVIRAEERTKRTLRKMQRIGRRIWKKVEMDRRRLCETPGKK